MTAHQFPICKICNKPVLFNPAHAKTQAIFDDMAKRMEADHMDVNHKRSKNIEKGK